MYEGSPHSPWDSSIPFRSAACSQHCMCKPAEVRGHGLLQSRPIWAVRWACMLEKHDRHVVQLNLHCVFAA